MSESFWEEDILESESMDNTYVVFRREWNWYSGGMILTKDNFSAIQRVDSETNCDLIWAELILLTLTCFLEYSVHPSCSSTDYLSLLENSMPCISVSCPIISCGDFNIPSIVQTNQELPVGCVMWCLFA